MTADGRVLTVIAESPDGEVTAALRSAGALDVRVETLSLEEILIALLRERTPEETSHV